MGGIENATYDLVQNKVWKSQVFLTSGTFVAPAGVVFVSGCGGGAAGQGGGNNGGGAGAGCQMFPVPVTKGGSIAVTIGAGGTPSGGAGGITSFGSYLSLPGGASPFGGASTPGYIGTPLNAIAVGAIIKGADGGLTGEAQAARSTFAGGAVSGPQGGGGGGFYGVGGAAGATTGSSAAANSGAGGGSGGTTGGSGGSGKLIVFWQE